ncbi:Zinc finger protein [Drechslerella dactyloides]|uniref:Zinc finger protein n=1 Tax=Drechslerella dactyloides TaxID=74499 RepID=A0AAD6J0U2_DREDA|nr:Zinc finger protein [Drechslerella dactyloides]
MAVAQYQHTVPPAEEPRKDKDRDSNSEDHLADPMEEEEESDKEMVDAGAAPGQAVPMTGSQQKRKRRRSRKGMDKKYECTHPDCGKSYSRAEHLYRHQLNHEPKQIYNCCFPDCTRTFLQRKDMMQHSPVIKQERKTSLFKASSSPDTSGTVMKEEVPSPSMPVKTAISPSTLSGSSTTSAKQADSKSKARRAPVIETSANARMRNEQRPPGASVMSPTAPTGRRGSIDPPRKADPGPPPVGRDSAQFPINLVNSQTPPLVNSGFHRPKLQTNITTSNISLPLQSPYGPQTPHSGNPYLRSPQQQGPQRPNTNESMNGSYSHGHQMQNTYIPPTAFPPFSLPPPGYQTMAQPQTNQNFGVTSPPASNNSADHNAGSASAPPSSITQTIVDPTQFSVPVFGGDSYNRSPFMITDDFAAWLFDDATFGFSQASRSAGLAASFLEGATNPFLNGLYLGDPAFPQPPYYNTPYHHPMSVTSIIAPPSPPQESLLSEHKRQELIDVIGAYPDSSIPSHCTSHFSTIKNLCSENQDDDAVLGLNSMQLYISLFWQHFHPQLPILHRPTFAADKTENILLLAIIAIGAACVDRTHFPQLAPAAADLSCVLAMNLRWQIFDHADFRPPAKLWIFQALILLETHEKMYSTRQLHERAHIHHATTLTLMRRGSSLQGRCALDSPPSIRDEKIGGNTTSHSSGASTPDEWWNHWIASEATKRAAFAAFVLDSVHATMFGHSAVMVAHEMRLALPCDEALWTATSSAEVGRLKQALYNNGVKPIMFLEGLKRTLNGGTVRTNSFGRTIIMAGLLSVSWHMNQRDLQVNSLGVGQLGAKEKWRGSLTRAFDLWLSDFDKSLHSKIPATERGSHDEPNFYMPNHDLDVEHDNVFESRTVLHHLAHMAMHVDIVDLQIYAGAKRLLGRSIGGNDSTLASKKMKDWANTARARDAVYYALQFLRQVLLPTAPVMPHEDSSSAPTSYVARDDYLLNRPWVLYFATLVVWAYGVALDGPLQAPIYVPQTSQERHRDMRNYLIRVGHRKSPDELSDITDRNRNLGLLLVLQKMFGEMRWELLQEASKLLGQCIEISKGLIPPAKIKI